MFYIGFQTLDEFICAIDYRRPVYLAPLTLSKSGTPGTTTASLVGSQPKGDHLVYFKVDVARWHELYGQPFGPEETERAKRAPRLQERMMTSIIEALRAPDEDLDILEGAPSFPSDLMLIPGTVEGVTYDAELHDFVKEVE